MTLAAGTRLGPYEIRLPLGAGGMGEVYQARDTRLERTVAVKVLPSHMSSSEQVRKRFEREAKTISQLSHPHICALYDVGHQDGIDYLVMEYLEGQTLAERLAARGALPLEQVLRYAVEIADALDRAHRSGIIHRDLKPGNVMLTKSGVKLLDFGLAKEIETPLSSASGLTALPTVAGSPNLTQEGTILGTFQYMAPEQLEGREADPRTDIFAFGAVLYEMATGRKAFEGSSHASLISAILRDEPRPISSVQPLAPAALDRLVTTCLSKDPDERWQTAHDLKLQLQWIAEGAQHPVSAAAAAVARRKGLERVGWVVGIAATAAAVALAILLARRPQPPLPVLHASLAAPEGWRFDLLSGPIALSPDGSRIAFVARGATGKSILWIRSLDSQVAQALPGTEDAKYPFWSPDGRTLAYFAYGLYIVSATGGTPEKLADFGLGRGGTWNRDGVMLLSAAFLRPLARFSLSDRKLAPATQLDEKRGETNHVAPHFLPDGRHFLYLAQRLDPASQRLENEIYVQSLGSEDRKLLLRAASNVVYAPPGYLLFRREGDLVAQPFDAATLSLTGDPFPVAKGTAWFIETHSVLFSVSDNGTLVYARGGAVGLAQLSIFDRDGKKLESIGAAGNYWTPRLSRDGRRIAFEMQDPVSRNRDIWLYDLARPSAAVRFTFDPGEEYSPVWSPDASRIAFVSYRKGSWSIDAKPLAGTGGELRLLDSPGSLFVTDWSADGERIAFNRSRKETRNDAWVLTVRDGTENPAVESAADDRDLMFSPDGRWIAYMSVESGREEVFVRAFSGPDRKWQVSTSGGLQPRWRPDGNELFYVSLDGSLMAVAVKTEGGFEAGVPHELFTPRMRRTVIAQYAVFPEGRRFLINALAGEDVSPALELVQNWTAAAGR